MKLQSKIFKIQYTAQFISKASGNKLYIWLAQPLSDNYQKIRNFRVSYSPADIYNNNQGNKILFFPFKNFREIALKVNIFAELYQDGIAIKNKRLILPNRLPKRFLENERFLEQTPAIKKLATDKTQEKNSLHEKTKSIFDFITDNFKYRYPVKNRGAKNLKLDNLIGDCGEYSGLLVAMLRILGIPSRNQTGFVIDPKGKKIVEHGWACSFFKGVGWLDLDVQFASQEKKNRQKYFCRRSDYRINFINGFNIPLKPTIPKRYLIDKHKKTDTPHTDKSVQTLQPLFFASKKTLKFSEKTEVI